MMLVGRLAMCMGMIQIVELLKMNESMYNLNCFSFFLLKTSDDLKLNPFAFSIYTAR